MSRAFLKDPNATHGHAATSPLISWVGAGLIAPPGRTFVVAGIPRALTVADGGRVLRPTA